MECLMLGTQGHVVTVSVLGACFIVFLGFFYLRIVATYSRPFLPPGPPSMPIIGNLLDMPRRSAWLAYKELSRRYGKLVYLHAVGREFSVVDDANIAIELLEKHSKIFSSRPESTMVNLTGLEWALVFTPYGSLWRRERRLFWQHFHSGVIHYYFPTMKQGACNLLSRLLVSPEKHSDHVRYTLGASVIKVTYGSDVAQTDDKCLSTLERGMEGFGLLAHENTPLFEEFPNSRASHNGSLVWGSCDVCVLPAKQHMRFVIFLGGKPKMMSVASAIIEDLAELPAGSAADDERIAKEVAAVIYAGGIDTPYAAFLSPCLSSSMCVQRATQADLDAIVRPNRLPKLADRQALPYVVKSCSDGIALPLLGCPRMTIGDFEHSGYFIPQNTVVAVNVWSIMNDPKVYPSPERFWPERYLVDGRLNPNVQDPAAIAFGFGRRICPGQYFGDAMLFTYIASILHTLHIAPPYDDNGNPIHVRPQYTNGFIAHLQDCRCTITSRSASAEALIRASEMGI